MFQGFYLNLERNADRREAMERNLAQAGLQDRYKRFPAVDGRLLHSKVTIPLDPGNLGLWMSNEQLLAANLNAPHHLHIVEDDVIFAKEPLRRFNALFKWLESVPLQWDLIFTDVVPPMDPGLFQIFARQWDKFQTSQSILLLDLNNVRFAGTTSFFVNRHSIEKLYQLIRGNWSRPEPIDLYLRHLIHTKQLRAHVTTPFLTSVGQHAKQSDILGQQDVSRQVVDTYRRAFFIEADLNALQSELEGLTHGAKLSQFGEIFFEALRFAHSDRYEPF